MKKAQMEMFGLAVIVILVFIGMIFLMMVFARMPDTLAAKEKYTDQTLAQNLLTATFKLNTTCSLGIPEIVKDCYLYKGTDKIYKCDDLTSCEYTKNIFDYVINNTLVSWNRAFVMNISSEGTTVYSNNYLLCKESIPAFLYVSLYPEYSGTIDIRLDVCR